MKKMRFPTSYTLIPQEEQRALSGGGPFLDAVDTFIQNMRLDDLLWGGSFIALSFTFVPSLLFNVIKSGVQFTINVANNIATLMGTSLSDLVSSFTGEEQPAETSSARTRQR